MKQCLHPQSVAEISCHSVLSGQDSTMSNIIWVSSQGHRSVSVSRHFLLQALQCPCSVRKRFSRDHCCRGRSKPGCWIVLLDVSRSNGGLRISGWIGQLSCLTIFFTSLLVAASFVGLAVHCWKWGNEPAVSIHSAQKHSSHKQQITQCLLPFTSLTQFYMGYYFHSLTPKG